MSIPVNEDEGGGVVMTSLAAGGAPETLSVGVSGILNVMDASACSALHDEADELQWIADSYHEQANAAKSWADLNHLSHWNNRNQSMHRSILKMDLSYEDFSKNMDVNLAQIDMETFRSEDINHAILSLQARVGEECASLSGSLIDDLPIDSSQRVNEICRKTPLFSPLKEASVHSASHISMADSLDCSYHGDLVLTCQTTNKNNYTLAFEQSQIIQTDPSEDSELGGSSEAQSNWSGSENANEKGEKAMIHSEFAYTTWSRVSGDGKDESGKSHSLPDLLKRSISLAKTCNTLYTINDCQVVEDKRSGVPLLRMFMDKGKGSQDAMQCSTSVSEAETREAPASRVSHARSSQEMDGSITLPMTTLPIFNARSSTAPEFPSANAVTNVHHVRARQKLDNTLNNNNVIALEESTALSEEDSSQCFEDSLVGMLQTKKGLSLASPIREEDEQCSSCDEPMRDANNSSTNSSSNSSANQSPPYEKPPPKINNFVGQRASPARKELLGSESSGYISRQNSSDQINKSPNAQQFLLCAGNRRSASKVGSLQCSTQVRTVAIQTGPLSPNPNGKRAVEPDCHVVTPEQLLDPQSTPIKKSIYVCYPNYSLPDLSFLKDIKPGHAVVLQPTEIGVAKKIPTTRTPPVKEPQHKNVAATVGTPSRRRAQSSGPKCRPKSYTDCEAMLRNGVDRIKDWESLSLLLPDDIKMMVKQIRGETQPVRMREKGASRQPRPLRIDQIASAGTGGYEEVYISGGAGVHIDERDGSSQRRHSLLNFPSLTGLVPTGLDLNTVASPHHAEQSNSNSSGTCYCRGAKKAVSFSDNLCKVLTGDHRTPATCGCRNFALNLQECITPGSVASGGSRNMPFREHTPQGLSPSGFISPLTHSQHEVVNAKRHLLEIIYNSIRLVVDAYGKDKDRDSKMQLLSDESQAGREVVSSLVPAVERLLEDGLLPHVRGLFGPLPNSKWHLVESMVQTKEGRKEVRELLDYIHSVNGVLDESAKFRCFVLGLINLGCLDTWITLLLATASVQQKHYQNAAFLVLLSHYSFFFLQEELVSNLRVLSELPFAFNLNMAAKLRPHQQGAKEIRSVSTGRLRSQPCTPLGFPRCSLKSKTLTHLTVPPATPTAATRPSKVDSVMRRTKTEICLQGRARPLSYPAALKKEPEPPKKDTHKFRQLRNQWEKMSGALPNRPAAAAVAVSGNIRVNQADNLRSNRHSQPAARHSPAQKANSSPHRGSNVGSPVKKSCQSGASSVASSASTMRATTNSDKDPNSVVLVRKSLIPIRGMTTRGSGRTK